MRSLLVLSVIFVTLGCGGSGNETGRASIELVWSARGRNVVAPVSAESARIVLQASGAALEQAVIVNRPSDSSEDVSQHVEFPNAANEGSARLEATFFSQANAGGSVVGVASGDVQLRDGESLGTISTVGKIERVVIRPDQSVVVGETQLIDIDVYGAEDSLVAVADSAHKIRKTGGDGEVTLQGRSGSGVRRGIVQLAVTVDGVSSPTEMFSVSPRAMTYLVDSLSGPSGLSFINDISSDGSTAVGSSSTAGAPTAIRWTRTEGTVNIGGLTKLGGANVALCVNGNGTVIAGANANDNESAFAPWVWTAAGGVVELSLPEGLANGRPSGISDDGTVIVGTAQASNGQNWAIRWQNRTPGTAFQGTAHGIAPDGSAICGAIDLSGGRRVGFVWLSGGYFFRTDSASLDNYVEAVYAVSNQHTVAVGRAGNNTDAPGFWTPGTGPVLVNGTITTRGTSISSDGILMGISGSDAYLAMLFTKSTGLVPLGRYFDQVKSNGGPDLVGPFVTASCGPAEVNGISSDRMTIAGTAVPDPTGNVRGFVTDYSGFRKL